MNAGPVTKIDPAVARRAAALVAIEDIVWNDDALLLQAVTEANAAWSIRTAVQRLAANLYQDQQEKIA